MIIWVASYPRSGNRLTRTLLYKTMGLRSTTEEFNAQRSTKQYFDMDVSCDWDEFYHHATQSNEVFLVKTHRPPRDEQPAIYILRDGRKACLSYSYFHQHKTLSSFPSLMEIVMGQDFYGSWSDHYRMWEKRGNLFVVRFEDLVNASDSLLIKLAEWVRYSGEVTPWVNPFEEERKLNPHLVREGKVEWQGDDPAWTSLIDSIFFHVHGELMVELGYASLGVMEQAKRYISDDILHLVDIATRLYGKKMNAEKICHERQEVINGLKLACDERLALIEKLIKSGK